MIDWTRFLLHRKQIHLECFNTDKRLRARVDENRKSHKYTFVVLFWVTLKIFRKIFNFFVDKYDAGILILLSIWVDIYKWKTIIYVFCIKLKLSNLSWDTNLTEFSYNFSVRSKTVSSLNCFRWKQIFNCTSTLYSETENRNEEEITCLCFQIRTERVNDIINVNVLKKFVINFLNVV